MVYKKQSQQPFQCLFHLKLKRRKPENYYEFFIILAISCYFKNYIFTDCSVDFNVTHKKEISLSS